VSIAVLYRWRADPAKAKQFEDAWAEGTRLVHTARGCIRAKTAYIGLMRCGPTKRRGNGALWTRASRGMKVFGRCKMR